METVELLLRLQKERLNELEEAANYIGHLIGHDGIDVEELTNEQVLSIVYASIELATLTVMFEKDAPSRFTRVLSVELEFHDSDDTENLPAINGVGVEVVRAEKKTSIVDAWIRHRRKHTEDDGAGAAWGTCDYEGEESWDDLAEPPGDDDYEVD